MMHSIQSLGGYPVDPETQQRIELLRRFMARRRTSLWGKILAYLEIIRLMQ